MNRKHLLQGTASENTVVFCGGTSNKMTRNGKLTRNTGRDGIHALLETQGVNYFDPQIHPETHGRDYDYGVDGPAEQSARKVAKVLMYEVGDGAQGVVTALEVINDALAGKQMIVWLNSPTDPQGKLTFNPDVDMAAATDPGVVGHLKEYVKNATNLRNSLRAFVKDRTNVRVCLTEADVVSAINEQLNS